MIRTKHKRHFIYKKHTTLKNKKMCKTDDDIGKICSTGQYSTYTGNIYKNPVNLARFKKIADELKQNPAFRHMKTHKERYTYFLKTKFHETNKVKALLKIKNDFYGYANSQWFDETDIENGKKTYYVQFDDFRIKQEEVYYKMIDYTKTYIKNNPHSKKAQCLNSIYKSMVNNTTKSMYRHVDETITTMDGYIKNNDMYGWLANINSDETISWCCPIQWSIEPDEKDVSKYISHISLGQLGLYDNTLYDDGPEKTPELTRYKASVKREYLKYIEEVFKACLGKNKYNPQDVWDVENELINALYCEENIKNADNFYNKVSAHDLTTKYDFDWATFATRLGFKTPPKNVIIGEMNSFKCTVRLLKEKWNTEKWQTFWLFSQFKQLIRFENTHRHIHFNFYNNFLEGQPIQMPDEIYPIFVLSLAFNTFLSEQYIEHNYNPLYVNYTKKLCDDLKYLLTKKVENNTWLDKSTIAAAVKKLNKLSITVGSPTSLRYDPLLHYKDDDPVYNIKILTKLKHEKNIELENMPVIDIPKFNWFIFKLVGTQCYIVNAAYKLDSNSIYIPLAYLQKPFIDLEERGLDYNLVYIAYTLCHELSHALDDAGSLYDENGNLNNWWTKRDRETFDEKIKDVIKQYEEFARRDGIDFKADISTGEDIADIAGFGIIEAYLLDNQILTNEPTVMKKINLAKMYLNFAIQGRQKIYKKAIKAQLKMNPHPLDKYRINCVLARSELFKMIYGVKKGDGMYWNNDTIW